MALLMAHNRIGVTYGAQSNRSFKGPANTIRTRMSCVPNLMCDHVTIRTSFRTAATPEWRKGLVHLQEMVHMLTFEEIRPKSEILSTVETGS